MSPPPENELPGAAGRRQPGEEGMSHVSTATIAEKKPTRQAAWAMRNPMARWAHIALASALRRGLIERGGCEVCGATEVDGHHDDYTRPMAVRWFCRLHHKGEHRRLRQGGAS